VEVREPLNYAVTGPHRNSPEIAARREGQTSRPTVYPSAQNKPQRQRDQQAARRQQEVLEMIETAHFPTLQG
jgi:hypothetical protein